MIQRITQELVDDISNYLRWINTIPYINHGGCGYVALSLYDMFARRGFKPKIGLLGYPNSLKEYRKVRYNRRANNRSGEVADHYVVEVDGYYFDSNGGFSSLYDIPSVHFGYEYSYLFRADLVWLLNYGEWNYSFMNMNDNDVPTKIRQFILNYRTKMRY